MTRSPLKTAAVQLCSTDDMDANLRRASRLVDEAAVEGARLVVLPENFAWLDREGRKIEVAETLDDGRAVGWARETAARLEVTLVAGSVALRADGNGRVTNTSLVIGTDGSVLGRYDKIHLFDIELDADHTFRESRYVQAGDDIVTVVCDGWCLGLSVCYDLRFPELYRGLVDRGADVLLVPSAFTARTGRAHWEILMRARAIENQCYVVAGTQWGRHNRDRESWGQAMIVDPWGEIVAELPEGEGIVSATLDPDRIDRVRRSLPALEHRRIRT